MWFWVLGMSTRRRSGRLGVGHLTPAAGVIRRSRNRLVEFVGEQRRRGRPVLHPPLLDASGLLLRALTDEEFHVVLAAER